VYEVGPQVLKVADYASNRHSPKEHAELGVALCRWFGGAFHIWDDTGSTGAAYRKAVLDTGYRNIFYRESETSVSGKKSDKPGFSFAGGRSQLKGQLFNRYKEALRLSRMINCSNRALNECAQVIFDKGDIVHAKSLASSDDPRKSGDNHADLVVADVLAWRAIEERPYYEPKPEELPVPENSIAGRRLWHKRQRALSAREAEGWL